MADSSSWLILFVGATVGIIEPKDFESVEDGVAIIPVGDIEPRYRLLQPTINIMGNIMNKA